MHILMSFLFHLFSVKQLRKISGVTRLYTLCNIEENSSKGTVFDKVLKVQNLLLFLKQKPGYFCLLLNVKRKREKENV